MASDKPRKHSRITAVIFSLLFLLPGLGVILFGPVHTLFEHAMTANWERVPVTLEYVRLTSKRDSDGPTTNAVQARYHYEYKGQPYTSTQVGYGGGSDNISDYHERLAHRLERARSRGTVKAWVDPQAPSESYLVRELRWKKMVFMTVLGTLFAGAGGFLMWLGLRKPSADPSGEKPISSSEKQSYWLHGFMAFAFLAVSYPGWIAIPRELKSGNWLILLVLVLPLSGLWLGYTAWKTWRGWRHYGPAPLSLDPAPGQVGGDIGGRIVLAHGSDNGDWTVTLQCLKVDAGSNRSGLETMLWHKDQEPEVRPLAKGMEILFRFEPPEDLPTSGIQGSDQVKWRLLLSGGDASRSLERTYYFPVVQGTGRSSISLSDAHVSYHEQQGRVRAITEASEQIDVRKLPNGLALHSRIGRHLGMKLIVLAFGLAFGGFGAWMWQLAADDNALLYVMGSPFLLIGLPLVIGGVFMMGRSLTVRIEDGRVLTVRYWLGIPLWRRQGELTNADQLTFHGGLSVGQGRHTTDYVALAMKDGGKTIRLAEGLVGLPAAEAFRDNLSKLLGLR